MTSVSTSFMHSSRSLLTLCMINFLGVALSSNFNDLMYSYLTTSISFISIISFVGSFVLGGGVASMGASAVGASISSVPFTSFRILVISDLVNTFFSAYLRWLLRVMAVMFGWFVGNFLLQISKVPLVWVSPSLIAVQ